MVNIEATDPEQQEIGDAAPLVASIRGAGAGKTRLAQFLQHAVPDAVVAIVPMDGFHLALLLDQPPWDASVERLDATYYLTLPNAFAPPGSLLAPSAPMACGAGRSGSSVSTVPTPPSSSRPGIAPTSSSITSTSAANRSNDRRRCDSKLAALAEE